MQRLEKKDTRLSGKLEASSGNSSFLSSCILRGLGAYISTGMGFKALKPRFAPKILGAWAKGACCSIFFAGALVSSNAQIPGSLVAKQSGPNGFVATWGIVTDATGYEVQVSTEPSFTSGLIGGDRTVSLGTITSLGITGISSQIRYYRVRSVLPSQGGPLKTAWSPAVSAPDRSAFGKYATLNATGNADSFQAAVGSSANNNSYTISFWMRPDRLGGVSGTENVQVVRQGISSSNGWANVDLDLLPGGSLSFGQKDGTQQKTVTSAPSSILASNWYHVALVRDATNSTLKLYLNGGGVATNTNAFGLTNWTINNSMGFAAKQDALNDDGNTNLFRGAMDDVRVYRTVRTPAQILQDVGVPLTTVEANNAGNASLVFYAPMEGTSLGSTDRNSFFKGELNGSGTGTITSQSVLTAPVLAWTPSPINLVAPAVLSTSELTATAGLTLMGPILPGIWSYSPAAGASLSVGTNTVVGTFVPTDLVTYAVGTITNQIVVTEPSYSVPGVETGPTNSISGLTQTSVKLMGGIMNLGGTTVTNAGFYLNTNSPATNGVKYSAPGSSFALGSFSNTITGLTPGTSYYYRAFAANSVGTGYGASEYSFTTPSPFTYTTSSGEVTITGYTGTGGAVVIPSSIGGFRVTKIADSAFSFRTTLTNITIPDSVLEIGQNAFYGCSGLLSATIGNGVTTLPRNAFSECVGLTSVSLGASVKTLGDYVFNNCKKLTSITFPAGFESMGTRAFALCAELTSITFPQSVTAIGSEAFYGCTKLSTVYFQGNTPPTIEWGVFSGIANGAMGYYPTTASTAWGGVTIAGLSLVHPDTESPVITLIGGNPLEVFKGATFSDPGATVTDNKDATRTITGSGTVNTATVGIYTLTYTAQDLGGNLALPVTRTVNVVLNPAGDEDGDGLNNGTEISGGTNPYQKDSDNDGVNDFKEVADGTNPTDANSYNSLSQGLVAYYPFSGDANDSSGNGNNGIPVSPVLSADRLGAANAAYTFNGTSDRIDLANSAALNMNNGVPFSMSAWIKTDFNDGQRVILAKAAGASGHTPALFVDNEGKLRFDNFEVSEVHSNTTVRTGNWMHVAVTYDGSTYRLYVNGVADGERAFRGSNETGNSWTFSIGGSLNTGFPSGMFKGSIDEVQFWSRTLSPTEVAGVVQASSAPANRAPVIAGQSTTYDALAEFIAGPAVQSASRPLAVSGRKCVCTGLVGELENHWERDHSKSIPVGRELWSLK